MMSWIGALVFLTVVTLCLAAGIIPTEAMGLARVLFVIYASLLAFTLVLGLFRRT